MKKIHSRVPEIQQLQGTVNYALSLNYEQALANVINVTPKFSLKMFLSFNTVTLSCLGDHLQQGVSQGDQKGPRKQKPWRNN